MSIPIHNIQCIIFDFLCVVNGVQPAGFGDVGTLRKELQMVRDRINGILDHINPLPSPGSREPAVPDSKIFIELAKLFVVV